MALDVVNVYGEYKEKYCTNCCGCNGNVISGKCIGNKVQHITHEQIFMCATVRNIIR